MSPQVKKGNKKFFESCASCHKPFNTFGSGPFLLDVAKRLNEKELHDIVAKGRPDKGMPSMQTNQLSEEELGQVLALLEWVSVNENEIRRHWDKKKKANHKKEYPIPAYVYPDRRKDSHE